MGGQIKTKEGWTVVERKLEAHIKTPLNSFFIRNFTPSELYNHSIIAKDVTHTLKECVRVWDKFEKATKEFSQVRLTGSCRAKKHYPSDVDFAGVTDKPKELHHYLLSLDAILHYDENFLYTQFILNSIRFEGFFWIVNKIYKDGIKNENS